MNTNTNARSKAQASVCAQQLADALPVGVAIVNPRDEIVFSNRRFQELTTSDRSVGLECLQQSVEEDDFVKVAEAYRFSLRTRTEIRREYRTAGQTEIWCALSLTPLDEDDLEQFGLADDGGSICMISDITPEKKAELLQRKIADHAKERKQQQERFIDMISHEVRNPLSAILHCAEDIMDVVAEDAPEDAREQMAKIAEAAETINLCVAHQKKIIDDVLIYSKLDSSMLTLAPQQVQPKSHLATLLTMFRPELRKQRIEFQYQLDHSYADCDLDWVIADLDKMGQVLINLVSNAIKFTAEAKDERLIRVSMGAARVRPPSYPPNVVFFEPNDAALRLDSTSHEDWGRGEKAFIMVAVKDTGIGISDQHQKLLFERFKQATPRTDRVYGGYGLGLNISRRICHMHGGEIGVSSKEGDGSTFGFFFTVRRCAEGATPSTENGDVSPIDELCYQIQELDSKTPDVKRDTSMADFSPEPPVKRVNEVAISTTNDDRKGHSVKLANEVAQDRRPSQIPESISNVDEFSPRQQPTAINTMSKLVKGPRVLFVEDNIINQRVVFRKLKVSGFEVTTANNGQEALDAWGVGEFDCILMDQEMPVMDGSTATKEIRALEKEKGSGARVPIIGVTANVRENQQQEMFNVGMETIIHKPYKMQDLVDKIWAVVPEADKAES